MTYTLVAGKLYTTTVNDYPIVYENTIEDNIYTGYKVTQIYLKIGCILLYTGKSYIKGTRFYEFLYHTNLVKISDLTFLILKDQ